MKKNIAKHGIHLEVKNGQASQNCFDDSHRNGIFRKQPQVRIINKQTNLQRTVQIIKINDILKKTNLTQKIYSAIFKYRKILTGTKSPEHLVRSIKMRSV